MYGSACWCLSVKRPTILPASHGCKQVPFYAVTRYVCVLELGFNHHMLGDAGQIAPTSSERSAKRAKLLPIKDEEVKPIPVRARSVYALDSHMQDVRIAEPSSAPAASAPSMVCLAQVALQKPPFKLCASTIATPLRLQPITKAASQASGGTVTDTTAISGPKSTGAPADVKPTVTGASFISDGYADFLCPVVTAPMHGRALFTGKRTSE